MKDQVPYINMDKFRSFKSYMKTFIYNLRIVKQFIDQKQYTNMIFQINKKRILKIIKMKKMMKKHLMMMKMKIHHHNRNSKFQG